MTRGRAVKINYKTAGGMEWMKSAACGGVLQNHPVGSRADLAFHPEDKKIHDWIRIRDRFCSRCPVKQECLRYGIARKYYGVWGGEVLRAGKIVSQFFGRRAARYVQKRKVS